MPATPPDHHRRTIRLKEYDYTQPGAYFVTLVTWQRQELFGKITGNQMHLSPSGEILTACWMALPNHFPIQLDAWAIMPNHFHGILVIVGEASADRALDSSSGGTADASPLPSPRPYGTRPASLGAIIQNFKSISARRINTLLHSAGATIWQRNYYEHIIRNETEWNRIRAYILANPHRWEEDQLHPNDW